jgi:hypothetical protein
VGARHLILAACKGRGVLTSSEVVVYSWLTNRKQFGLEGFEQLYPDSRKILCELMGNRGLVAKGLMLKLGVKKYKVTLAGEAAIGCTRCKTAPTLSYAEALAKVLSSTVYVHYKSGFKDRVSLQEAMPLIQLDLPPELDEYDKLQSNGCVVSREQIKLLRDASEYYRRKFASKLG